MSHTVAAVYTSLAIVGPVSEAFSAAIPNARLVNIVDDSMIQEVIEANEVTSAVERRLLRYLMACEDIGATVILNTCSSIGEAAAQLARYIHLPVINIDDAMARAAVRECTRVAVLATLPSTLRPTVRLIQRHAAATGRTVGITEGLADGAFDALINGDPDLHDRILEETACRIGTSVEAIVLAQGSMARIQDRLKAKTGLKIYTSIESGIASVQSLLDTQVSLAERV